MRKNDFPQNLFSLPPLKVSLSDEKFKLYSFLMALLYACSLKTQPKNKLHVLGNTSNRNYLF